MKKTIIIFCVTIFALSLTAFVVSNSNDNELNTSESKTITEENSSIKKIEKRIFSDFIYDVGPRFTPITKTDLHTLKSFNDYIGLEHVQRIVSYKSISVMLLIENEPSDDRITGNSNNFNNEQLDFFQSLDYSTNLMIWADYKEKNPKTGDLEDAHWTPYLTIVPEKQAEYTHGKEALIKFLKEASKEVRIKANVDPEKLQPAKLFFTVTKNGGIKNVKLDRTSNYPLVDKTMIDLIKMTPELWQPAENSKGEKVDQELVVSFGLMGC